MKCERDAWIWLGIAAVCFACSYGLPLWAFIMEILLGIGNAAFACYSWWQAYGARRDAADCDRLLDGSYG